jgi:hypothetical protein
MKNRKELDWAIVLSTIMPGLGQIGRSRFHGFIWMGLFWTFNILAIRIDSVWVFASLIIYIFNLMDAR